MATRKSTDGQARTGPGSPKILTGEVLGNLAARVQQAIAHRAYDHYRERGGSHGHDLGDWFRAENALQKPGNVQISEVEGGLHLHAEVLGFGPEEIEIGVGPRRIIIWAERLTRGNSSSEGSPRPGQSVEPLLGELDLPAEINPAGATARLAEGILEIELPLVNPQNRNFSAN